MNETRVPVVVLAGGPSKPESRQHGWPEWRALAEINGRPVLSYVLDALRSSSRTGSIAVVGPEELRPHLGDATLLPAGTTMWDNVHTGLSHAGTGNVLLSSADVPLLTLAAVDDIIDRGLALGADFVYPIIRREHNDAQCPGMKRTYATLVEGTFTGGNLMLVNGPVLLASDALIRKALAARKKPLELARMLNLSLVVKVLCRRARIAELERQVSRVLGARAMALPTPFAEIGADLDTQDEAHLFEKLLAKRDA